MNILNKDIENIVHVAYCSSHFNNQGRIADMIEIIMIEDMNYEKNGYAVNTCYSLSQ